MFIIVDVTIRLVAFKICFIPTPDLSYDSGSTVHAKEVMSKLAMKGYEVHAIVSKEIKLPRVTVHPNENINLYHPVICLRNTISSQEIQRAIAQFSSKLVKIANKYNIDLVHAFYPTFTAASALIGKWLCGTPYVISSFGRDITIGCVVDSRYRRMARTSFQEAVEIVASNERIAMQIATKFGVQMSKISVIPMGVDTNKFKPHNPDPQLRKSLKVRRFMILMIASDLHVEKGFETLLRAIPLVRSKFDVKFVVIGADASPGCLYQKKWDALARELRISDSLIFVGKQTHDYIPEYIAASDIVVDPRTSGAFSSSVLEALASGKPVIASDSGGVDGIIESNYNGLLFKTGDECELAKCIESLLKDRQLRNDLGTNASRNFNYEYTLDACIQKLIQVYERIIARSICKTTNHRQACNATFEKSLGSMKSLCHNSKLSKDQIIRL